MAPCNATHDHNGYRRKAHLNDWAGCGEHYATCTLRAGHDGEHADETHAGERWGDVPRWRDGAPIPPYTLMVLV